MPGILGEHIMRVASGDALVVNILGRDSVSIYDASLRDWVADPAPQMPTVGDVALAPCEEIER